MTRPSAAAATVKTVLSEAAARLEAAGCGTPRLDAELLLAEILGTDRGGLVVDAGRELTAGQAEGFETLVVRREAREPVAYLLGRKEFRHLELMVDARVLIPRPETELLVEAALDLPPGARVIEVGTGSGAVALALKQERPDLRIVATDISGEALEVARANAQRHDLDVELLEADLLEGAGGPYDAVLANVPYVDRLDYAILDPEIGRHEPEVAIVAGDAGAAIIRRLVSQLGETPYVALEVGLAQEERVAGMLSTAGYATETRRDLAGIERVVIGRRR
ncbi:MAG TPA: peptide chain release factor N(5)-glutamine methyltransferase [Solirubrobacteraceae bacterium]|nr:peptide chain release factor N(5)-glutamine methyltransferase [Solirubrobacteraceae bacterium]